MISVALTRTHSDSRELTCTHLDRLGFTRAHWDPLHLTWTRLDSLELTWIHVAVLGFAWTHLDSLGLIWIYLGSLGFTWTPAQNKKKRVPPQFFALIPIDNHTARTHARTKRNDQGSKWEGYCVGSVGVLCMLLPGALP